jgi:putative hemolysin
MRAVPALIKAYLRLGGCVGEGAFVDHAFNTIDVCLVMDTARLSARQRALYSGEDAR